jgi:hypothetical protein
LEEKKKTANSFLFSTKKKSFVFSQKATPTELVFLPCGTRGIESRRVHECGRGVWSYYLIIDLQSKTAIAASPLVVVFPSAPFTVIL